MHLGICKNCGKTTEYEYKSWVNEYCSYVCARLKGGKTGKWTAIKCEYCGEEFELLCSTKKSREKNGDTVKYCSRKCSGLASRKRKVVNCITCNKPFETTRNKNCSKECGTQYRKTLGLHKRKGYWMENGYKVLYVEGNKSIKEHIKMMEEFIGRKITKDEAVHHINGVKDDNRIENLQLLNKNEHLSLHRRKEKEEGRHLFGGHNNN